MFGEEKVWMKTTSKCFQDDSLIVVVGETTRFQHNGTLSQFGTLQASTLAFM
jgi:hypothetical protein